MRRRSRRDQTSDASKMISLVGRVVGDMNIGGRLLQSDVGDESRESALTAKQPSDAKRRTRSKARRRQKEDDRGRVVLRRPIRDVGVCGDSSSDGCNRGASAESKIGELGIVVWSRSSSPTSGCPLHTTAAASARLFEVVNRRAVSVESFDRSSNDYPNSRLSARVGGGDYSLVCLMPAMMIMISNTSRDFTMTLGSRNSTSCNMLVAI